MYKFDYTYIIFEIKFVTLRSLQTDYNGNFIIDIQYLPGGYGHHCTLCVCGFVLF